MDSLIAPGSVAAKLEKRKTKRHYTFAQWCGMLDAAALTLRWRSRIVKSTGDDCWRDYFDEGLTPTEALIEDCSYAV